ncbi:GNAT family N-acetyltransferase [Kordiimonas sp.]|uniref:GNAT family N-acetyltransferase n=1 Tax=Kordiimonas sp. TaxID=1970157 RepID=UPI003A9563DE
MTEILPIETERLIIRAFRVDDATAFHGWRNDAEVARLTLWDYPYPMEHAVAFCRRMAITTPFPEGEYYQLMIEEKASGQAVGDIGIGSGLPTKGAIRIGYSLSTGAQGKGYMTEALEALLPALIEPLRLERFTADIDARNPASGRVLERLGFKAGPVHEKRTFVKGEWCDEIDYEVSAEGLLAAVSK